MILYAIIILAVVTRFIPHMANIGVITALAIFGGAYLPKKQAVVLPLVARFVSDAFLGFFSWKLMLAVYASHLVGTLFGMWIKTSTKAKVRWLKIVTSGFGTAVLFFLITNFAFLYSPAEYPHTIAGILLSYTNGLPFFRGTLIGDIGYTVALFGAYEFVRHFANHKAVSRLNLDTKG